MTSVGNFKPFSRIIGQERAITFLKAAMSRDRIPHAYLFTGIQGVGKSTTALALTQAINCERPTDGEGCGLCRPCRQVMKGSFPDLIYLAPEGQNIKIEQIRELNNALSYKPSSGRHRVTIIQQAEAMTAEAANAFLKTLEEPPPGNIFILNVSEPLDLLPTIVSRCQKIPFSPLSDLAIKTCLMQEKDMNEDGALILAKVSEGSLGRSLSLFDSGFLEKRKDYLLGLMGLPGLSPAEGLQRAVEYAGRKKGRSSEASDKRETGLFELLSVWKTWQRDLILMKVGGRKDHLINVDFSQKLEKSVKFLKLEDLIDSFFILDAAQRDFLENRNPDLLMETTVLALRKLAAPNKG